MIRHGATRPHKRRRPLLGAVTVLVAATALSACGSSSSSASKTNQQNGSSGSGSNSSAAAKLVAQYEQRPTSIGTTTKLQGTVPSNVTIMYPECGTAACSGGVHVSSEAASLFGWNTVPIATTESPASVDAAWAQVVREKPTVAVLAGTPYPEVANYINQAAAEGVYIIGSAITEPASTSGPIKFSVSGSKQTGEQGIPMAAWVVNNAEQRKISNPGVLYVNVPDFTILGAVQTYFTNEMKQLDPSSTVDVLNIGFSSLDGAATQVVTYLRSHPNIQYLAFSVVSLFDNVVPAVHAAGLSVDMLGTNPDPTDVAYLKKGEISAAVAYPMYEASYATMNHLAWYLADPKSAEASQTTPPDSEIPLWLVTQATVPDEITASQAFPIVPNVAAEYAQLWGKSCKGTYSC